MHGDGKERPARILLHRYIYSIILLFVFNGATNWWSCMFFFSALDERAH